MYPDESVLTTISQSKLNYIRIRAEINIFFNYLKAALASFDYLKTMSFLMSSVSGLAISKNYLIK